MFDGGRSCSVFVANKSKDVKTAIIISFQYHKRVELEGKHVTAKFKHVNSDLFAKNIFD
jgi:5,10-methylene-tetrahydrofolate dehydrogenase/methenyl tetrahydrofolate cyclohydrolase